MLSTIESRRTKIPGCPKMMCRAVTEAQHECKAHMQGTISDLRLCQ